MDFVNDLEHNEQLISSKWTIEVTEGFDPNPTVHLEGTSAVVIPLGSNLKTCSVQRVGGVWPDVTYKLEATVLTTQGNTRSLWSHLRGVSARKD